jgi:SAM-dependent methyltransferase
MLGLHAYSAATHSGLNSRRRESENMNLADSRIMLDVGCAHRPKGDVNVDLFINKPNIHVDSVVVNPKKIPNFVLADAQHLPFASYSIDHVYCSHLIEHVDNPYLLLQELIRVSRRLVEIYTPHRLLGWRHHHPGHRCHFTLTWFAKALAKIGCEQTHYTIGISEYRYLPHSLVCLARLPIEIKVLVWKT